MHRLSPYKKIKEQLKETVSDQFCDNNRFLLSPKAAYHDLFFNFFDLINLVLWIFHVDYKILLDVFIYLLTAVNDSTTFCSVLTREGLIQGITRRKVFCSPKDASNINYCEITYSKSNFNREFNSVSDIHIVELRLDR